ncbi:MAG: DNA-binding protein WhiA [Clostridia bacterium]|nr:DNA-binding protein WhiA [Clostridia bacterium]
MSFAYDVKTELCAAELYNACCRRAQLYAMLLYGRSFSQRDITLRTEHEGTTLLACALLEEIYAVRPCVRYVPRAGGHGIHILSIESSGDIARVLDDFGYAPSTVSFRLNRAVIENDCCNAAFLRGAFLSCGSVVEPEKDYHLEFVAPHVGAGRDLSALLGEQGLEPKTVSRSGSFVVYFRESGQIEDFLTLTGAAMKSLELMNIKVYKDLRNKANRVTNCETANIDRTAGAAARELDAIRRITAVHGMTSMPEELRELAALRLANPELTLRELGERLGISRSGVNHRLRRILALAQRPEAAKK